MVRFFSGNSDELADQQHGWTLAVVVIAILCAILFYGCFAWTKERVKPIKEQQGSLKDDLRDLLRNKLGGYYWEQVSPLWFSIPSATGYRILFQILYRLRKPMPMYLFSESPSS